MAMVNGNGLRPLSAELLAVAVAVCKEDPNTKCTNIAELQAWIRKSPHLKASTNEHFLLSFLRCTSFSLEEAKKRIDYFYAMRAVCPEVLCDRVVNDSLLEFYRTGIHTIPENPVRADGPRVIICQIGKFDPNKSSTCEAIKLFFMLLEVLAIEDDNASVAGIMTVIDARDVGVQHMMQYDPCLLNKSFLLLERCVPLKFCEIHLINMRCDCKGIFKLFTSILPKVMPFKFIVHKKAEDLYEYLPRDAMPIEYGGHNGYQAEALDAWERKLQDYKAYFAEDASYGTNEKLRVGLSNNWETGELCGVTGSFRKLEVD